MSGGRKVIPRQAGSCPSALPISLSHYLVHQSKGETPSTWKIWSSYGTELTTCRTAKDDIGISTIEGSSPQHPNKHLYGSYRPTRTEKRKVRTCTYSYRSFVRRLRCYRPGSRYISAARIPRKTCSPHPERRTMESASPFALVTWNRTNRSTT